MKKIRLIATCLSLLGAGCSFIPVVPGAEKVRLESPERAAACEHLGKTHSNVLNAIMGIERSRQAIASDLFRISANSAVEMGGNALVPVGEPIAGKQTFEIYRCK